MNLYNFFKIQHTSNLNLPKAIELKSTLETQFTTKFEEIGLTNYDTYLWYSNFDNKGISKLVKFKYRGVNGNFLYGLNFDFIPEIKQNGKLIKNKKDLKLYDSFSNSDKHDYKISLWNIDFFKRSLFKHQNEILTTTNEWFTKNNSIEKCIETTIQQINSNNFYYKIQHTNKHYLLAFLYAKLNDKKRQEYHSKEFLKGNTTVEENFNKAINKI